MNHFEPGAPKDSGNVLSIMGWVTEVRHVPIFPVTDDEGNASVRKRLPVRKKPQPNPQYGRA
jgi:hypothetical protein